MLANGSPHACAITLESLLSTSTPAQNTRALFLGLQACRELVMFLTIHGSLQETILQGLVQTAQVPMAKINVSPTAH